MTAQRSNFLSKYTINQSKSSKKGHEFLEMCTDGRMPFKNG